MSCPSLTVHDLLERFGRMDQCRAARPVIGRFTRRAPNIDQLPENIRAEIPTRIEGFHKSASKGISSAVRLNHGLSIIQLK